MEILVGTNAPINLRVFWRGECIDADVTPSVTANVYDVTNDPEDTEGPLIATLNAEKRETDPGSYDLFLPFSITQYQRELKIVWKYYIEGVQINKSHTVYVVSPYVDLGEAINEIGISSDYSDPNSKTFKDIVDAERYARKQIESYTGQMFRLYDDTYTVYATGSDLIPLPQKISTLHELYVNDVLLVDTLHEINNWGYDVEIAQSGFGLKVNRSTMLDNTVYVANGMVPPTVNDSGRDAFVNGAVYKVSGKFGWREVPDDVSLACIELMKDYFAKDKTWRNKYIKNIQTFDWKFEYNEATFNGTGNNYVDQLLSAYVLSGMVVV